MRTLAVGVKTATGREKLLTQAPETATGREDS